jgi:regulator of sigma E protease
MVRLIPLGGYVSMAGEEELDDNPDVPKDQRLCNKSWIRRLLVMVAGVINNFILGFVLLFIMGLMYGTTSTTNTLDSIPESGALYKAGARNGDIVTKINDKKVKNYDDIQTYLALVKEGDAININILKQIFL